MQISILYDQYIWARSPVRLDLAGGWSDTPPYTFKYGGKVVHLSVNLNDELPVQVYIRRSESPVIKLQSIDQGISECVEKFDQIACHANPQTSFGLTKAALHLLGFNQESTGEPLPTFLENIGGGFDITLFVAVPKGSGLGVSSIIATTLLGSLHTLFGEPQLNHERLLNQALKMEQMLTTGGGWQDQVGGMIGGVKFSESSPCEAYAVKVEVEHLDSYLFEEKEYARCFTLYYTGQSRLANDVLRRVVERVKSGDREYLSLHEHLKQLACEARKAISRRDLVTLGKVISCSWEANKQIERTATNEHVNNLLEKTKGYYLGAKLLGAGGGGYCLFVSESPDKAEVLQKNLVEISSGNARLVDWSLNKQGLKVSLS